MRKYQSQSRLFSVWVSIFTCSVGWGQQQKIVIVNTELINLLKKLIVDATWIVYLLMYSIGLKVIQDCHKIDKLTPWLFGMLRSSSYLEMNCL